LCLITGPGLDVDYLQSGVGNGGIPRHGWRAALCSRRRSLQSDAGGGPSAVSALRLERLTHSVSGQC
jgi:hypothetical protein